MAFIAPRHHVIPPRHHVIAPRHDVIPPRHDVIPPRHHVIPSVVEGQPASWRSFDYAQDDRVARRAFSAER